MGETEHSHITNSLSPYLSNYHQLIPNRIRVHNYAHDVSACNQGKAKLT